MNEWETCIDEWAERLRVSQKETADAQATIADLHGQIDKLANFIMREVPGEPAKSEGAVECAMRVISVLQQRVAQLEAMLAEEHPGLDEACDKLAILQADHARVLGLVQALLDFKCGDIPEQFNKKNPMYEDGDETCPFFTEAYLYVLLGKEDARSLLGLIAPLRPRSLPAQPAQSHEVSDLIDRMAHINDGCECRICKPAQGGA